MVTFLSLVHPANPLRVSEGAYNGKALGMVEIWQNIMQEEGPKGLYRGLLPNFLKVIPAVSIGYVVYEQLKLLLGVETIR